MTEPSYGFAPSHQRGDSKLPLLSSDSEGLPLPASPSSRTSAIRSHAFLSIIRQRRLLFVGLAFLSVFALGALSSVTVLGSAPGAEYVHTELASHTTANETTEAAPTTIPVINDTNTVLLDDEYEEEYVWSPAVLGPPTARFRDNLRSDVKYITSWISAGWSMYF